MRGFPDPNPSMRAVDASGARTDRGHFVAHTAGGPMDMNLFPQRRDLILRPEEGWWIGRFSNRGVEGPTDRTELTTE
jgi:hypothetical protein